MDKIQEACEDNADMLQCHRMACLIEENKRLKAELEKLKCCGCCKWGLHSAVTCMHVDSSFHGTSTHSRDICDCFEARSK